MRVAASSSINLGDSVVLFFFSFLSFFFLKFCTVPLQCLWRDSVTLISTLLLTYLLTSRRSFSWRKKHLWHRIAKFIYPPVFNAPVGSTWLCRNFAKMTGKTRMILSHHVLKKVRWCVKPFRYNTGTWQTDRRTDGWTELLLINVLCWRAIKQLRTNEWMSNRIRGSPKIKLC